MAVVDDEAKAVLDLINSAPIAPTQEQIVRAILGVKPEYWRAMLLPGVREFQGEYNQDHPDGHIDVDIRVGNGNLFVVVQDAPRVSVCLDVNMDRLRSIKSRDDGMAILREALAIYEQKAAAPKRSTVDV